jgi:hypothetical protein
VGDTAGFLITFAKFESRCENKENTEVDFPLLPKLVGNFVYSA